MSYYRGSNTLFILNYITVVGLGLMLLLLYYRNCIVGIEEKCIQLAYSLAETLTLRIFYSKLQQKKRPQ